MRAPCSYDPGGISVSRDGETSMWSAPIDSVADSHDLFLSRLDRTASHSLCTLRSQRHRWTTQHSVPAGSLLLAGQVHLLLGHYTRFQLYVMSHPPRPSSSGAHRSKSADPAPRACPKRGLPFQSRARDRSQVTRVRQSPRSSSHVRRADRGARSRGSAEVLAVDGSRDAGGAREAARALPPPVAQHRGLTGRTTAASTRCRSG
jgi:hypothetical protein